MKDRISLYPGRVELTPVPGQTNVYDMIRADEPQEVGTPLNKATLLKDDVAMLLGLDTENATPSDVFEILLNEITTIRNTSVKVVYGIYGGNGNATRTITFTGTPIFLYLVRQNSSRYGFTGMCSNTTIMNPGYDWNTATITWNTNSITLQANYYNESQSDSIACFNSSRSNYTYMIICE